MRLVKRKQIGAADGRKFAMHSLDTSPCTQGLELRIGIDKRSAQRQHHLRSSSGCVERYRRDDFSLAPGWLGTLRYSSSGLTAFQECDPSLPKWRPCRAWAASEPA